MTRPNRTDARHEVEDLLREEGIEGADMLADEIAGIEGVAQTWKALDTVDVQLKYGVEEEVGEEAAEHLGNAADELRDAFTVAVFKAVKQR